MTIILNNHCGSGNTVRNTTCMSDKVSTNTINGNIIKATDPQFDYSKGQPEYQGTANCDPARDGAVNPPCCKGNK